MACRQRTQAVEREEQAAWASRRRTRRNEFCSCWCFRFQICQATVAARSTRRLVSMGDVHSAHASQPGSRQSSEVRSNGRDSLACSTPQEKSRFGCILFLQHITRGGLKFISVCVCARVCMCSVLAVPTVRAKVHVAHRCRVFVTSWELTADVSWSWANCVEWCSGYSTAP